MPNRQKISVEEKVEYVRAYPRGEITQGSVSYKYAPLFFRQRKKLKRQKTFRCNILVGCRGFEPLVPCLWKYYILLI